MYRKKLLITLMVLLAIFLLVFIAAILAINRGVALFSIGIPFAVENWLVIILSIIAMVRIVWEIILVEEHKI